MPDPWKPCSVCKKPIFPGQKWYKCSVSTCNSTRLPLVFCSMGCWDAHVPTMNHRSGVWATDERAPAATTPTPAAPSAPSVVTVHRPGDAERRMIRPAPAPAEPDEVLIIASRLKDFVKAKADYNTSADVMEALSDIVRDATLQAIDHARSEGRRTVMARDFRLR